MVWVFASVALTLAVVNPGFRGVSLKLLKIAGVLVGLWVAFVLIHVISK